jgi:CRISPR-associated protein Cmr2
VPWAAAESSAVGAKAALWEEWRGISETARGFLTARSPAPDARWTQTWTRQVEAQWETYWSAAALDGRTYAEAYQAASAALDAAKRTRSFAQVEEAGRKDTLSGRRAALRTEALDATEYWKAIADQVGPAQVRSAGRERLDAIGSVKRFCDDARRTRFPSTSSVAAADFAWSAGPDLDPYRNRVEEFLGSLIKVDAEHPYWPYDGDLLYVEGLSSAALRESYGASPPEQELTVLRRSLLDVYKKTGKRPALYYAILALDGDNMGAHVEQCLQQAAPEQAHHDFSDQLIRFAAGVPALVHKGLGAEVYSGGDDVLALVPLANAVPTARSLAEMFQSITKETASAGLAIAHHTYPLGAALRAARQAERMAKQVPGKAAVCVRVLKRGGPAYDARSPWSAAGAIFDELIGLFVGDEGGELLSTRFAYEAAAASYALPVADDAWEAEIKRLLGRHRARRANAPDPVAWAAKLRQWAGSLPGEPATELGHWLVFARFVAQHGGE